MSLSILFCTVLTQVCLLTNTTGEPEQRKLAPAYVIKTTKPDKSLKKSEALFLFSFLDEGGRKISKEIAYSCDGKNGKVTPDVNGAIRLMKKPGKHKFQFFYTSRHEEIYTDSINIAAAHRMEIDVTFQLAGMEVIADKPVIYLYPEKEMQLSVKVQPEKGFKFTYPAYNNGWKCTAYPDGTIKTAGRTVPYLFWEGGVDLAEEQKAMQTGFLVEGKNAVSFLEVKLTQMGLNAKESTDFITYWAPKMAGHKQCLVRFLFNEEFDKHARLSVEPKPDTVFRIFMIWSPVEDHVIPFHAVPQQIPSLSRKGFTVVEWGGTQLSEDQLK